jgi:Bcr/CflA subfamily drug resistance transporter
LSTLMLLTGLAVVTTNLFLPSLPHIAEEFETSYSTVSFAIAGYFAVTAVLQLLLGPLSDRYGRRPVVLTALVVFIFASIACALATSIETFMVARVFQGAITVGFALTIAIVRDCYHADEAASRISYVTMVMAVAPMLGPTVGGLLDQHYGWRACFWFLTTVGIGVFAVCWFNLHETNTNRSANFAQQFRQYPSLFGSSLFWAFALCGAFSVAAFHSFLVATPLVAAAELGLSPAVLGMCMGSITAGFMTGSFLSGRLAQRVGLQRMILTGRIVGVCGLVLGLLLVLNGVLHIATLFGSTLMVGLGNGLTMPSCNASIASVKPRLAGSAMGLAAAVAMAVGSAITWMTGTLVPGEHSAVVMLSLMLGVTLMSLLAAIFARHKVRSQPLKCFTHLSLPCCAHTLSALCPATAWVCLRRVGAIVRLQLEDDGPGIPEQFSQRVFERFYRMDSSRGSAGNGLGLSLVKSIAELHDGSATTHLSGGGAGFTIEIPVSELRKS